MDLLLDKAVNDRVQQLLAERREPRRIQRAARAAADERSAEYREARRQLHEAQAVKSPDLAFLEAVFKVRELAEYLHAVSAAVLEPDVAPVPTARVPDLLAAVDAASEAVAALRGALRPDFIDVTPRNDFPRVTLLESQDSDH
jgi:hypothetical protein